MRWDGQAITAERSDMLPGLESNSGFVRSVTTPEFAGVTFHEVLAKSALNKVGGADGGTWGMTINPYRGCSHACVYCFARPTHTYLEFDGGADFDQQIVVKTNVADVLTRELAKPSWDRHPVALGTNTDPYQRAEGRYRLMPGIIRALAESGTPFSILTKGSLLRRDIPLLAEAAKSVPVDIAMSIAVYDDDLQQSVEPGTPTTSARLATVRAVRDAGLDCSVFLMPVLPYITDTRAHLQDAVGRAAASGATSLMYSALHLKPGIKPWWYEWLGRTHPDLVGRYRSMYLDNTYAPKDYRRWLAERVRPILREHGLSLGQVDPATGSMGFSDDAVPRTSDQSPLKRADPGYAHRAEYRPTKGQWPTDGQRPTNGQPPTGGQRTTAARVPVSTSAPASGAASPSAGSGGPRLF
ncbi:Rv2578c family radical SAM protein [Curtobacterium herbarum]|uniref:Rv2578c family radical SAM protein n=1 Tax=Curtobacterium herbarum TaxID=150122 RepID=A0ABP4KB15_9MICO|nr:Rv2578c family radical SAM protein [Curtobacterium herbarum]MBM7474879.1 DNA repair photolyase [Curtobacterium herbarum]MCS6545527.1 Rv2578c family radical SAM protein [Curtobacterium herbarum]